MLFVLCVGECFAVPVHSSPLIYKTALAYKGLHERKNNKRLRGFLGVNPRRTPWCGAFMKAVLEKAGEGSEVPVSPLRAVSWKEAGNKVDLSRAKKGDVVVLRFRRGNHVGIYVTQAKGRIYVLGGNQSNSVRVSSYPVKSIRAIRRVSTEPTRVTEKGSVIWHLDIQRDR